ncbi:unnamed protein product, partial [Musa acuminata subsp. burmannicoides]
TGVLSLSISRLVVLERSEQSHRTPAVREQEQKPKHRRSRRSQQQTGCIFCEIFPMSPRQTSSRFP